MWSPMAAAPLAQRAGFDRPILLGAFPGNTAASLIGGSASDQQLHLPVCATPFPTVATITGILTDPNFRVVIHALEQRTGI